MKDFTKNEMEVIDNMIVSEIPEMIKRGCSIEQYYGKRAELNIHIIQFAVGGELAEKQFGKRKGENTFKFNRPLPTASQIAVVAAQINNFVLGTEKAFLEAQLTSIDSEDMNIPEIIQDSMIGPMEKATNKNLKAAILGENGVSYYEMQLGGLDVVTLAGIGADARKHHNFQMTCIIAGATVLVAGSAIAGYFAYNKYNKYEENKDERIDLEIEPVEIDTTDDGAEMPEVVVIE